MKHDPLKKIVSTLFIHFNNRNWEKMAELFSENLETTFPQTGETIKGKQGYIEKIKILWGDSKVQQFNLYREHDRWDHQDTIISEAGIMNNTSNVQEIDSFMVSIFVIEMGFIISATHYLASRDVSGIT